MNLLKELNLNSFFASPKNYAVIFFNESTVLEFLPKAKDPKQFLHWVLFVVYKEDSNSYEFLKIDPDAAFTKDGKGFSLRAFHQNILETARRWRRFSSLAFPDILIRGVSGASYSSAVGKDAGMIQLSLDEVGLNPKSEFVLAHELGHFLYNKTIQNTENESLKSKSYFRENPISASMFLLILGASVLSYFSLSTDPTVSLNFLLFFMATQFLVVFYAGFFEIANWLSFKERLKFYSREFYADHFAQIFTGYEVPDRAFEFVGGKGRDNLYTHPGGTYRIESLVENRSKNLESWNNLVISRPKAFARASLFEVNTFWNKQAQKLKQKF